MEVLSLVGSLVVISTTPKYRAPHRWQPKRHLSRQTRWRYRSGSTSRDHLPHRRSGPVRYHPARSKSYRGHYNSPNGSAYRQSTGCSSWGSNLQGLCHIGNGTIVKHFAGHLFDGSGQVHFLLCAITDHDHFVQRLRIFTKPLSALSLLSV